MELTFNRTTDKATLYKLVNYAKQIHFKYQFRTGVYLPEFWKSKGVIVEECPFKTHGLRGMAVPADLYSTQKDIIILNSFRSTKEKNFDCAHESIHITFHWKIHKSPFSCYDKIIANQDSYLEWQANEGAAEYLVPYKIFIPLAVDKWDLLSTIYPGDMENAFLKPMSDLFNVPTSVIRIRLISLKAEIEQYINGVPLENLHFYSNNELIKNDMKVYSIFDIQEINYLNYCAKSYYCL